MTIAVSFPAAVRAIRAMHRLSQGELSSLCGHGQSWCSRVERGELDPSIRDLALLSHTYGLQLIRGDWAVRPPRGAKTGARAHAGTA